MLLVGHHGRFVGIEGIVETLLLVVRDGEEKEVFIIT